ncbi:hypothetical protein OIDMADRAFT_32914 [Oidiodendron maius Zn]|uniref:Zn(2)-C6 fungal-type domain-containing protein n=1 Tax=Oidiodendron maius (strain Zn) TaxID=913774 RepID=A0A0C3H3B0_OIDMZ|nr:hypothetical protein OIDMADRAFT_32914 [Oidiodendron maius Zn]
MFTTLRCDPNVGLQVDSEQSATVLHRNRACKHCHSKKLRCTRERNGCRRCIASNISCQYESSRLKSGRKRLLRRPETHSLAPEASFDHLNTARGENQFHTNLSSDAENLSLAGLISDPAQCGPRFEVPNDFFEFFNGNFGYPSDDTTISYSRLENLESSQLDTSMEEPIHAHEPNSGVSRETCNCLPSVVSLLESTSIQYIQANLNKKSEFVMLLIFLCQKIISSYQRAVAILTEQFNRLYRPNKDNIIQISVPSMDTALATAREVELREYHVDVEEEPYQKYGIIPWDVKGYGERRQVDVACRNDKRGGNRHTGIGEAL